MMFRHDITVCSSLTVSPWFGGVPRPPPIRGLRRFKTQHSYWRAGVRHAQELNDRPPIRAHRCFHRNALQHPVTGNGNRRNRRRAL